MQQFLRGNAAALGQHLSVMLVEDVAPLSRLSMRYSVLGNTRLLDAMHEALDEVLAACPPRPGCDLLISCEGLSGRCPGWRQVSDYAAARDTVGRLTGALRQRFSGVPVDLVLTTRDTGSWLWSAWRHHVRGQRLTEDWEDFRARLCGIDLRSEAGRIAAAVPGARLHLLDLAQAMGHPQGPGGALVDLVGLPAAVRAALQPVAAVNHGQDAEMSAAMLALNRSALADAEVEARKAALAAAVGAGRWGWRKDHEKG